MENKLRPIDHAAIEESQQKFKKATETLEELDEYIQEQRQANLRSGQTEEKLIEREKLTRFLEVIIEVNLIYTGAYSFSIDRCDKEKSIFIENLETLLSNQKELSKEIEPLRWLIAIFRNPKTSALYLLILSMLVGAATYLKDFIPKGPTP
ncbi:MAG: hypothetical protein V3R67_08935 [Thermodesulfobacteriota bacterium]